MRTKIAAIALIAAFSFIALPAETVNAQGRWDRSSSRGWQSSRRGNGRGNKKWYPRRYKNYGQYRSAQAHRRNRYRLARRYYWRDGIRLTRWIRIYY